MDEWYCEKCDEPQKDDAPCIEWRGSYICQSCADYLADFAYERMKDGGW